MAWSDPSRSVRKVGRVALRVGAREKTLAHRDRRTPCDPSDPVSAGSALLRRRALVVAISVLGLALLSAPTAGRDDSDADRLASVQQVPTTAEQVDAVLVWANPGLQTRERQRIGAALMRSADRYGLAPDLVLAVILVESDARPEAYSPKGALGLMQVMPHMMRPMGLAGNATTVESNIEAGCYILADNIRRWGFERGISAYFWGGQVRDGRYLEKVLAARDLVRERSAS